jgi:hypothetical protein
MILFDEGFHLNAYTVNYAFTVYTLGDLSARFPTTNLSFSQSAANNVLSYEGLTFDNLQFLSVFHIIGSVYSSSAKFPFKISPSIAPFTAIKTPFF